MLWIFVWMNHIISSVLRKPLLMNLGYAQGYAPLVKRYLSGALTTADVKALKKSRVKHMAYVVNSDSRTFSNDLQNAPYDSTLVIPIKGAIMKDDFCGDMGTASIISLLQKVMKMDTIKNVILDIDSGGGSVDGTFELCDFISNEFTKPITAYVNGLCASAAYAIACACDNVIASHAVAEIGSIGVCITVNDWREHDKMNGITEHYINATGSPDKNKAVMDARDGDYSAIRSQMLDPIFEIFTSTVKRNRAGIKEEAMTGMVYMATDAMKLGLIDDIKLLHEVIEAPECDDEEDDDEETDDTTNPLLNMFNKFPKLAALKGVQPEAITEEVLGHANRELIEAGIEGVTLVTEESVSNLSAEIEQLNAAYTTAQDRVAELEASLTQLQAAADEAETLRAEVARLGQLLPEGSTAPVKTSADVEDIASELSEADKYLQEQAKADLAKMNL